MQHVIDHLDEHEALRRQILESDGRRTAKGHIRAAGLEPSGHTVTMANIRRLRDEEGMDIGIVLAATIADC